ncbi:NAD(P)/FAD-dependent oxidoreductase [Verrucomicrobiota bacterium sgz303538]
MNRPERNAEVVVVGAGPAGSTCAAFCAQAGLRTILLERSTFPREKVCGDCLNPAAWPIIARLGLTERLRQLPHSNLTSVEFVGCDAKSLTVMLPDSTHGEIAIKRSALDMLLLQRARELGGSTMDQTTVIGVKRTSDGWRIETPEFTLSSRYLVAADGRNSTVARLLGLQPSTRKDRVALQTHLPIPSDMHGRVRMQFVPEGYTGLADIGEDEANLCLVARPENLERLREWAIKRYQLPSDQSWRTITPLSRAAIHSAAEDLLLVGDAARVVEPFTGEGISYALRSGEIAAQAIIEGNLSAYPQAHARLYRGRLWVNQLAKAACLRPDLATIFLRIASRCPSLLTLLTRKVVMAVSE